VLARVKSLVTPLENLPFNVFDRRYSASWEQVCVAYIMHVFKLSVMNVFWSVHNEVLKCFC